MSKLSDSEDLVVPHPEDKGIVSSRTGNPRQLPQPLNYLAPATFDRSGHFVPASTIFNKTSSFSLSNESTKTDRDSCWWSHSANSSPTRLLPKDIGEHRRSSESGRPLNVGGYNKPRLSRSLSRSPSLKTALAGRQSLSTIASLMQSQSLDVILRGKRRSRRASSVDGTRKGRQTSRSTSLEKDRNVLSAHDSHDSPSVEFKSSMWSPENNERHIRSYGLNEESNAPDPSISVRQSGAIKDTGTNYHSKRRISFGTLPNRRQVLSADAFHSTPPENQGNGPPSARKISFGGVPSKLPDSSIATEDLPIGVFSGVQSSDEDASDEQSDEEEGPNGVPWDGNNTETINSYRVSKQRIKAIPRPTFAATPSTGEKLQSRKIEIHPNTNYSSRATQDENSSSASSSEFEDMSDIRRAQRLAINLSLIDNSIKHRSIRTIIRGDYSSLQREAEDGSRRLRTYLVATDLSGEAAYALEWTIGTVLRDGDTLIAVYAVQETGTGKSPGAEPPGLLVGEGGAAIQETQAIMSRLTDPAKPKILKGPLDDKKTIATSTVRASNKAEQERFYAIEEISQTCIQYLRKTKLQIRLGIEVVHCESPKHMITEAIDELEPTMVIVGSRGQSALKGVLLGSFSNYLVMKSSAPVMVARKKLRTADTKQKTTKMRLANNLSANKRPLSEARID